MIYAQPRILPGECDEQKFLGFGDTNGSLNFDQTTIPCDNQQKNPKKNYSIVKSAVVADHSGQLKESQKNDELQEI